MLAQRYAILRHVGPEYHQTVFLDEFEVGVANNPERAAGQPFHRTHHELNRTVEHTAGEVVLGHQLERRQDVGIELTAGTQSVCEKSDAYGCDTTQLDPSPIICVSPVIRGFAMPDRYNPCRSNAINTVDSA